MQLPPAVWFGSVQLRSTRPMTEYVPKLVVGFFGSMSCSVPRMPTAPVFELAQMPDPGVVSTQVMRRAGGSPAPELGLLTKPSTGSVYTAGGPAAVIGLGGYHQLAAATPLCVMAGCLESNGFMPCVPSRTPTLPHSARRPTLRVLVKSWMVWRALLMQAASQPVNVVPSQCGVQKF